MHESQASMIEHALHAASFQPRNLTSPAAWIGLIPFASWLTSVTGPSVFVELGTHTGNSYFAICQAVKEKKLGTRCYAVDTWSGDEHSGSYGDDVFERVNAINELEYQGFSTLLKTTFDEALHTFSDGSIDLLHIDGLHTYEAVRHDFETWLPKLKIGAIVLFHDTDIRERDFGVWKYWQELQHIYPINSQLSFSNGLGILYIDRPTKSSKFPDRDNKVIFAMVEKLKQYFASLGEAMLIRHHLDYMQQEIAHRQTLTDAIQTNSDAQITYRDDLIAQVRAQLAAINENANAQISYRNELLSEVHTQLAAVNENANAQISYRNELLAEVHAQLAAVNENANAQINYRDELLFQVRAQLDAINDNATAQILHRDELNRLLQLELRQLESKTNNKLELFKMLARLIFTRKKEEGIKNVR
jgi:Methyltransferase domain